MLQNIIHELSHIMTVLDAHQGSCMVLLTIALVACGIISCYIAARNIKLMCKLEANRSSPYVVLETTQSVPFFGIRMVNMGVTAARNIIVETQPSMCIAFQNYRKPIGFLDKMIPVLVPQKEYACDIGNWDNIKKECPSMMYRCIVRYESEWGEKYESEYVLDYSIYEHLIHREERTLTDLTKKFEEFCREFRLFATGHYKPHVLTEDYDKYNEKVKQMIEDLKERKKDDSVAAQVPDQSEEAKGEEL